MKLKITALPQPAT